MSKRYSVQTINNGGTSVVEYNDIGEFDTMLDSVKAAESSAAESAKIFDNMGLVATWTISEGLMLVN
jgi:hypothetical protein